MMRLTETAQGLVIAYPGWLGLFVFALGLALAVWVWRRFTFNGRFFGYVMGTLLALFGGLYFFTYKAELTAEGGRGYALFRGGHTQVAWAQARSAVLEERPGKGRPMYIVVDHGNGPPFEINVTDLSHNGRARVLDYIRARMRDARNPQR
ncbi:MAG: hypothetical protein KF834_04690 [Burkholderiales bacterium]|nr:hypothetical protein [Burkholderiales bacterium]